MITILISGKMQSGKGVVFDAFKNLFDVNLDIPVRQISFARKLKQDVCEHLGIPIEYAYDQDKKSQKFLSPSGRMATLRQFLQDHGQNMKNTFGNLYWTNLAIEDAKEAIKDMENPICDDARFPFELSEFNDKLPTIKILIERSDELRGIDPNDPIHQHPSETEIPNSNNPIWDYVIKNNGSISELQGKVEEIYDMICDEYHIA